VCIRIFPCLHYIRLLQCLHCSSIADWFNAKTVQQRRAVTNSLFFSRYVHRICLPDTVSEPSEGTKCWKEEFRHLTQGGSSIEYRQQVSVPIVGKSQCQKEYRMDESMICAGPDQRAEDSCLEKSRGGALACKTGDRFFLQGVSSFGQGCTQPGKYGVYAKVKFVLKWIREEIMLSS